jgi:Ca2+-binding EF-hand superfamily protein
MNSEALLKQYLDTGLPIPTYQYLKLGGNLKKTYLRKRFIAVKNGDNTIQYHEFQDFSDEQKEYLKRFPRYVFLYPLNEQNEIIDNALKSLKYDTPNNDIVAIVHEIPSEKMDYVIEKIFKIVGNNIGSQLISKIINKIKKPEEETLNLLYRWLAIKDNKINGLDFSYLVFSPQFTRNVHIKFLKKMLSYPSENWNGEFCNMFLKGLNPSDTYNFFSEMIRIADNKPIDAINFLPVYRQITIPYMQENILNQYIDKMENGIQLITLLAIIKHDEEYKKYEDLNPVNLIKLYLTYKERHLRSNELSLIMNFVPQNQHDEVNRLIKQYSTINENINRIKDLLK